MKDKQKVLVLIITLVLLIFIVRFGYNYLSGSYEISENEISSNNIKEAKDFTVYDEEGNKVKLSDFKGKKPVVVNIWASWCGPCKAEMPYFENAIKKYGDKVEFLMVNLIDGQRETKENAIKFLSDNDLDMSILFDEDLSATNAYNITGIPRTIFIDLDGNISFDKQGMIDEDMLKTNLEKIMK